MLRLLKTLPLVLAMAAFGIFATSCGTDHSQVRFVQASPQDALVAVNVDISVDSKSVATDLAFGGVAPGSGYLTVNAGNRTVQVFGTGTTTPALINSNINFSSQKQYTVLVSGTANSTTNPVAAVLVTDDISAPTSGNIKLRVIHESNAGPGHLDVYIVAPGTDISGLTPNISQLTLQQASGYQSLAAATYEVIVTDSDDTSKTPLINQSYALTAGQIRTLVVLDVQGGGALSSVPLELNDLN
jgi:hypothetical protein